MSIITYTMNFKDFTVGKTLSVFAAVLSLTMVGASAFLASNDTALAWSCEWIEANPAEIEVGDSTELSWSFGQQEAGVYVTIDKLPDEEFSGTKGSVTVSPNETTTYTATARRSDTHQTYSCDTTVVVHEPPVSCEAVDIHIDDNKFTWVGPPAISHYTVEFCDGSSTDNIETPGASDTETFTHAQRIRSVSAKGGQCELTVVEECPTTPTAPSCPFTPDGDTVVVEFSGKKIRSDKDEAGSFVGPFSTSLPAGLYTVETVSWDGYANRVNASQPNESWNIEASDASGSIASVGDTSDLADNVVEATAQDVFTEALNLSRDATKVTVRHAVFPDTNSPNSVLPICAAFTKVEVDEPAPVCTLTASPNRIGAGAASSLNWTTDYAVSFEISNSVGSVATGTGSQSVTPTATTTYVGTATNSEGETATCEATVEVVPETEEPPLACTMSVSASVVSSGSSVVVSWTSDNATSATVDNGIGSVDPTSSSTVVVSGDTTYTGTFTRDSETVTCSASVRLSTGGGGGGGPCINCGDDDDDDDDDDNGGGGPIREDDPEPADPTIVLSRTASAPTFVSLAQVPYTGFEAGPMLTMFFWLTVLGVSVALVYGAQVFHPLARLRAAMTMPTHTSAPSAEYDEDSRITYQSTVAEPVVAPVTRTASVAAGTGSDSEELVEEAAHDAGVLLSPEAARMIATEIDRSDADPKTYLKNVFDEAQNSFSREDGWILLSKDRVTQLTTAVGSTKNEKDQSKEEGDRISALLGNIRPDTYRINRKNGGQQEEQVQAAPVAKPTVASTQPVTQQTATKNAVSHGSDVVAFLHSLVHADQQGTYRTLRRAGSEGSTPEAFITDVVRALDEVYKHRIEGGHTPDRALVDLVASWDNTKIEEIIGLLVESVDYSYSSPRIGTKVALAKVFDYLARS